MTRQDISARFVQPSTTELRPNSALEATEAHPAASVVCMDPSYRHVSESREQRISEAWEAGKRGHRRFLGQLVSLAVLCLAPFAQASLLPAAARASLMLASQATQAGTGQATGAISPASPVDSLRPALDQVASALGQVQAGRWKLSRGSKRQLQDDVNSIQQDISSQLPGLFAQAKAASGQIGPQLVVMQNVNALYDVLVRVSTAANLTANKGDAGILDGALQQLEMSRKRASEQLMNAAALQDQRVMQMQALMPGTPGRTAGDHSNTIIVDNDGHSQIKHRKPAKHKKKTSTTTPPAPKAPVPE